VKFAYSATLAAAGMIGMLASGQAAASADLAKKHNCTACHQVDKKSIGPAYQEVAKKYKGQKDAVAKLSEKVKKGSSGVWGAIPMPPNAAVPDADVKALVEWVMSQAK
jgi:cytochrome c